MSTHVLIVLIGLSIQISSKLLSKMFNNLNKSVINKRLIGLSYNQLRCLRKRNTSEPASDDQKSGLNRDVDYLSIFDVTRKEIAGIHNDVDCRAHSQSMASYGELLEKRNTKDNKEKYLETTMGRVRLDADNLPKYHGQYDQENKRWKFNIDEFESQIKSSTESKQGEERNNIFEEQYFDGLRPISQTDQKVIDDSLRESTEFNFIDRQYFVDNPNVKPLIKSKIDFKYSQQFNQFLEEKVSEQSSTTNWNHRRNESIDRRNPEPNYTDEDLKDDKLNLDLKQLSIRSPLRSELFFAKFDTIPKREVTDDEKDHEVNLAIEKKIEEQKEIKLEEVKSSADRYKRTPRTAAQYLDDIQSGKETPKNKYFNKEVQEFRSRTNLKGDKLDSKGFRVLSGQVQDYSVLTHHDILQLLSDSILFNDSDIVAINKPYGMAVHTKGSKHVPVLTEFIPELSEQLKCEHLFTVHRLDRDTTGILLLAKSQERAKELNRLFAEHKIIKRYYCVTRGVPDHPEGVIDIPVEMGHCNGVERMVLRPEALEEFKNPRTAKNAKRAVTQYKVVDANGNAALIEVWPQTGVRHQIRVHLGFGLRCPILGDHKYSHLDKIAPQKLTSDMLLKLNVRQAKVRYVPMHLHARQYCLTGAAADGRNIFINAPFPHHFHQNMSRLGLRF